MNHINGYFQINIKDDGTYLNIYKPNGGGKEIVYNELSKYLSKHNIHDYNVVDVGKALSGDKKVEEVKLLPTQVHAISENMNFIISSDSMKVIVRFYPPSNGGSLLSKVDILNLLKQAKVNYGIQDSVIESFFNNRQYCTDYIIAKGDPIVQGTHAKIDYHFNTDPSKKPKVNEDGSVNFHELDTISHCKKGDVLATLTPAFFGKQGKDVSGRVLRPARVVSKILRRTANAEHSEDNLKLISLVNGHVKLQDNNVIVSDIYSIPNNVDNSTGDIDYSGNVTINGNVVTGFTVKTTGDVVVDGVVEGASIIAGGNIVLKRGIQGMYKGLLKAQGNIISKFIENTRVEAGGYITTESIMHSQVSAAGEITVGGRKGFVSGGNVRSGASITAKQVGSNMGTSTILEVGVEPSVMDEFNGLEKELNTLHENKKNISNGISQLRTRISVTGKVTPEVKNYLGQLAKNNIILETQIKNTMEKYNELKTVIEHNINGEIKIQGTIQPGAVIVISNLRYYVKDEMHYTKFTRDGADIKTTPL